MWRALRNVSCDLVLKVKVKGQERDFLVNAPPPKLLVHRSHDVEGTVQRFMNQGQDQWIDFHVNASPPKP